MIDRDGNALVVTCDGCRTTEEYDTAETPFLEAIADLQDDKGWRVKKAPGPRGEWCHWCPDCKREQRPFAELPR